MSIGAFAIIGAIMSLVDLGFSIAEEIKQNKKAQENIDKLRKSESDLKSARGKIEAVQRDIKSNLVDNLKDFADKSQNSRPDSRVAQALVIFNSTYSLVTFNSTYSLVTFNSTYSLVTFNSTYSLVTFNSTYSLVTFKI